ncbi:MAG TPA: amino acid adenylation domain-containing protein [Thermoanaerobaculia bacterium]|nr:amino acid adenylation domain-containing protein [Thermoanaerobaculia bacterium]
MAEVDQREQLKKLSPAQRALLAQALRERKAAAAGKGESGVPRRPPLAPALLSSGQRRMWLAQQMEPHSPAANLPAALRLDGALDVRALAAALTEVVRRHEVLRTGIEAPDGEPVPAVIPPGPLAMPIVDLAGLALPLAETESLRLAAAEARRPFDLSRPPVIRAWLLRTAPTSHLLLLILHHVAADGWSLAILVREMGALYGAFAAGLPSPLPELPIQYADYAAWQQGRLAAGELAPDLAYWRQRLNGLLPVELPRGRDRLAASAPREVRASRILPEELIGRVGELAKEERATLFMAIAAAFALFLGRLAEQDGVAFATPVAGRLRVETEGLIGFFVNTLVLRADLGGGPSFRQLLARLRTTVSEAHNHQELPFERLVEELAPERRAGRHPLVQILLSFQNAPREALSYPGLTVTDIDVTTGVTLFGLGLEVEPREETLAARLQVEAALWGDGAPSRLLRALEALLAAAVTEPNVPAQELPFLSAGERRQILMSAGHAPAPASSSAVRSVPASEVVERVTAIWAEILGLPQVGAHDSFWELGGHSLMAARVAARLRQSFGVDLPLRVVFDASTPAELAAVLAGGALEPSADASPLLRGDGDRSLPLSFGQRRLWFLHQLAPESPAYNIPLSVRMEGALDVRALAAALTEVVRRHEVLRTAIVTRRGEAIQEIAPASPLPLPVADLAALPSPRQDEEAHRLAAEEANRPFDLTRPPLLRALLVRLDNDAHRLVFNLHHIAGDGWSGSVLVREAGALYTAFANGLPSPLPELPLQYADYACWQRKELAGESLNRLLAYWRERLRGLPPLALPTDRPRPAVEGFRGARRSRWLPACLAADLERLAGERGATLFMLLAAGFAALLGRLSGQEDFGLAAPVAGRSRTELEGLIGFFVNTLVLRADPSGDPPFSELLARMRETALAAFAHQDLPFERLVEELGTRRDPARQPLAQALVVLQNAPQEPLVLPGLTLTPEEVGNGTAKLDLSLELARNEEGIAASLEVNGDLFDPATDARMLEQLEILLAAAAANPGLALSALPLLSEAARHQVIEEWGVGAKHAAPLQRPADFDIAEGLHRLLEAVAARQPQAIAVTGEDGESLTYGDLDAQANRLARHLRSLGVGPGVLVGICLLPSSELVVASLAVVKAGGAYVPLDPGYPRERLAFLLADAGAHVVVTRTEQAGALAPDVPKILLDADAAAIARRSRRPLKGGAGADDPLYVIYTSGSTGRPKGVVVTHRNVARLFTATAPWFGFGVEDVWTLFHSFAFDFSVWEIWGALLHGGRLVVVPWWVSRAPDAFLDLLRSQRVTVLNQTPSAFRPLIHAACRSGAGDDLSLRLVIFGGEALDPRHLAPWIERFGDRRPRLINMYGITETTVHVTYRPIRRDDASAARSPIGQAIPDLSIRLLDRAFQPVPISVPGEICVGGAGVARGYLGRPELTAERFVPDPGGARLYRSGDLGRWLPDGDLEVLGRIDHQVKVRGFRIELGEVEAALEGHPGVRESAVVAREEERGDRRLVAYVVPREEPLPVGELRSYLQDRLPGHMVPAVFVTLAALPLTRHGKLDRAALPAPDRAAASEAPYSPPETPVEQALAASWAEVLDVPRIGLDDDFFALGGDSIRAIQVRARAEERGALFTLQELFRYPTVRDLARAVRSAPAGSERSAPAAGGLLSSADRARLPEDVDDAFPLARTLAGLVFHSEYSPDYLIYLTSFHLQLPFDAACLQEALDRVVSRHPVLRSSLALEGFSEPLQLIHREVRVSLEVEDLRGLTEDEQQEVFDRWFAAEQRRKFDWRRPPLLRLRVHQRSDDSFQVTLSEPFLDGWSVGLVFTELFQRYLLLLPAGVVPAAALPLPDDQPLAAAFRDYVALEREALASEEHRRYWQRRMDGGGAGRLPASPAASRRAPDARTLVGRVAVPISEEVSDGLWVAARAASAPLKDLLLAVHLKVLSFLTGSSDVISGVLMNGRPEGADGDRVIGGFLNAMPFRVDLAPGSWLDLARQVFDAERELLAYRRFPLSELQQKQPEVGRPLFDTLFNFTHFHVYDRLARLPGLAVLGSWGTEQTYFPLTVQFNVRELTHRVSLAFDHPVADLSTLEVEEIAARYARVLEALARAPEAPHDALCLLAETERQQLLVEWNDGADAAPADTEWAVHERFAAWAARTPQAPALRWGEEMVTYGELAARAGRVARRLLALGLPAEARVGILIERSPDLVAAILGSLAAGAVYVPLDPAYPRERLEAMLEDSGARALVTRRGMGAQHAALLQRIDLEDLGEIPPASLAVLPSVDPAQLFVVIYTSGSTGRPKGVAVEHRSVAAVLAGAASLYPPEERTGVLAAASICFDLSVFELFFPLTHGGTAVLAENALDLPRLPAGDAVRLALLVPSATAELLRGGGIPPSVRTVVQGGEALPAGLAQALLEERPGRRLFNAYGPTEATIYSMIGRVTEEIAAAPSLGRPVPGGRVVLLDADLQPVLPGVPGEIWLGGRSVARGYLGQPDLTADRFRPDAGGAVGARLYRTGDLGRRLPDGRIEFLGRLDHQVKIRGFRIELGDVEAALARHPEIETAVVVDRRDPDAPGEARLIAYAVPRPGLPPAEAWGVELRSFLRRLLPAYMLPSAFVMLDALPLTSAGKVDRKALPSPEDLERSRSVRPWNAPRTPVEEVLCGIWTQVFNLERVSAGDDFFELGGHSLLATQLVSRVRETFAVELPLRALFDAPVLSDLAGRVERALRDGAGTAPPPLVRQPRPLDGAPLSFAQQRLWFLDRLEPGSPFYNVPSAVRLQGDLDSAALEAAFHEIVRRHEALRTRFRESAGRPVQLAIESVSVPLPILDLTALPAPQREAEAARLAKAEARRPFDLQSVPLLRLTLLRLAAGEHLLLGVFHHIVSDGWSIGVFLRETADLYRAFANGEPSPLPPLPLQYADFALWQRGWLAGEALERQVEFWRGRLAGVPPLELPADRPRPAIPAYRGARRPVDLDPALAAGVSDLARREGATLFMTLLAALSAVLGRWSGQESFAVGTPIAGRTRLELEPLIGFFVNTLVLPADLAGDPTGRTLLGRCREAALGAYAHQDLPFEKLVEALRPERELARAPLFQVLLVVQNTPLPELALPGLTLAPVEVETGTARFDLTLTFAETPRGIAGGLEHDAHLFDRATAARLASHLAVLLQALAADPGRRLSELPLLAPGERQQILREWSEQPPVDVEGPSIEERISEQARRTPNAIAVSQGERKLSYAELDAVVERLARALRARGVGPEVVVAIELRKSPEAIVAILAVLRAGGAYLPLDPAYPEERLAWLRENGRAAVTLDESGFAEFVSGRGGSGVKDGGSTRLAAPPASPAYLLYTSGSTGPPKGVVVTRAGLLASTRARLDGYTGVVSAFLLLPSLAFDSSVAGLFWTLCQGGTLVLPEQAEAGDPARLARLIAERRISHWLSIPSLYALLLDAAEPGELRSLAAVIVAGEPVPAELPRRHAMTLPGVPLLNEYGPTEATVWASVAELAAGERITVGRPIAGARTVLLDREMRTVPAGAQAELLLGGAGLARGYFGRPDLTAERFVPDPRGAPGGRLYRTGDLARWLPDGRLDLLGRIDEQVKIRGFRIEPGEIESLLERHPGVRQAAVVARELPSGGRRLAGCIVAAGELDLEALRGDLAARLPAYMVPAELIVFDVLPLSPNGKVDRSALRNLLAGRTAVSRRVTPLAGDLERRLAAIWEELLEIRGVGREDGFFDLGGHSLLAVQLIARIDKELGRRLPLAALFRGATLAALAAEIRSAAAAAIAPPLVPLREEGTGRPLFWFHALDGRTLCYAELAHHLTGRPLYGLETVGSGAAGASLQDLAARYAEAIAAAQPHGPYLLGGWSFGGLVAWETARRLEESGREVGLVILLDSRPPGPDFAPPKLGDSDLDPHLRAVVDGHLQALRTYRPRPLACPVALFLAEQRPRDEAVDLAALWRPFARGKLDVETVPADHFHLLAAPAVEVLAAKLRQRLEQTEAR